MAVRKKSIDKKMLFYIGLLALPLLQFAIFYVYVNFNSFFLSLHEYNVETYKYDFVWFDNFGEVFEEIFVTRKDIYAIRSVCGTGKRRRLRLVSTTAYCKILER